MQYTEQPTPPFNSPYQTHASRSDSLLEPTYLPPSSHEPMTKYPQGLGLYNYHQQVHTSLPPSPSPSDSWSSHVSSGASPLMTQAIADPYASGAFEHPIIRTPQPWEGAQLSPRPSASPATVAPLFSHTGLDNAYHEMNSGLGTVSLEGHGWSHDSRYTHNGSTLPSMRHHALTVAPERLNSTMLPYDHVYSSTQMATLEPTPATDYNDNHNYARESREKSTSSRAEFPRASAHPVRRQAIRKRRHTEPSSAVIYCEQCKMGFARNYNYKQHIQSHNKNRPRPYVCYHEDCQRAFVRKTDLDRHSKSVHRKLKDEKCRKCSAVFSRKDTCRRHEQDGCSQRSQVSDLRARL